MAGATLSHGNDEPVTLRKTDHTLYSSKNNYRSNALNVASFKRQSFREALRFVVLPPSMRIDLHWEGHPFPEDDRAHPDHYMPLTPNGFTDIGAQHDLRSSFQNYVEARFNTVLGILAVKFEALSLCAYAIECHNLKHFAF